MWPEYTAAYEDALGKISTQCAPWIIVSANRKWYRTLVVGTVIVETLVSLNMRHPAEIKLR